MHWRGPLSLPLDLTGLAGLYWTYLMRGRTTVFVPTLGGLRGPFFASVPTKLEALEPSHFSRPQMGFSVIYTRYTRAIYARWATVCRQACNASMVACGVKYLPSECFLFPCPCPRPLHTLALFPRQTGRRLRYSVSCTLPTLGRFFFLLVSQLECVCMCACELVLYDPKKNGNGSLARGTE